MKSQTLKAVRSATGQQPTKGPKSTTNQQPTKGQQSTKVWAPAKGWTVLACVVVMLAAACGGGNTSSDEQAETPDHLGDGSLGVVEVEAGEAVQIRSINAISGVVAPLGLTNQGGTEVAVADYGTVHGFDVSLGTRIDSLCTVDGGQAAAQTIVADDAVVGIIGTTCSGSATAVAPLVSNAGLTMVAPSNTSPSLTSDLAGTPGENYNPGYFRTSQNALLEGEIVARFIFEDLGITSAAALHDGDAYTQGLADAFREAFQQLGGTVTGFTGINKEDTDMVPVLTELAAGSPGALFFPIFQPAGDHVADQVRQISGLEDAQLLSSGGLFVDTFMELPQSEGMYFSGPDLRFGTNVNQSTGKTPDEVLNSYRTAYGESPDSLYWAHAYDATTMLLDAVAAASYVNAEGTLIIDRQGVRDYLYGLEDFNGLTGSLSCDEFGDCGSQRLTIIHHLNRNDIDTSKSRIVFSYARQ